MPQGVLIAPFKTGLDNDISPWLAPPDSFRELNNFHIRHGYIEKRSGFKVFGHLVQNTVATITGITKANPAVVTAANSFVNGQKVFISNVAGMTEVNGKVFTVANRTAATFELLGINSGSFGDYVSGGRAASFSGDRVMGIFRYFSPDGSKLTLAFDTKRACVYNGTDDTFDPLDDADIMSGSDTDYIWTENWQHSNSTNRMYFSNGKAFDGGSLDGIRFYDTGVGGVTADITTEFRPSLGGTRTLYGCKLMFAIKQRLVCLNIFERDTGPGTTSNFPQRARWCQAQGPSNWNDLIPGGGGFLDAPTGEQIISARALQDVIIVFFTNSVWTLRPTPNPAIPFLWDKINDFRACDGKMATAQYDRHVIAIGVRGITMTDGVDTTRVDDRIQDFTNDEINVEQFKKVYCSRNFENKRWWSLYPNNEDVENTKSLIFDEDSNAFSQYQISMNCLGYGNFEEDYGLNDFIEANDLNKSLIEMSDETLQSYFWQKNSEAFLGGDIAGIVYVLQTEGTDDGSAIDCNLYTNAWNPFMAEGKEAQLNFIDIYVNVEKNTQMTVEFYKDTDTSPYVTRRTDILPPLGFIAQVSNITQANPAQVTANQHGLSTGNIVFIYGVVGMVEIDGGATGYTITVVGPNNFTLDGVDSTLFSAFTTGGQVLEKRFYRTKSWKRVLAGGIGFQHSMKIVSSGSSAPLRIEAFRPSFKPIGRRTIN